jgi:hypothetical protein
MGMASILIAPTEQHSITSRLWPMPPATTATVDRSLSSGPTTLPRSDRAIPMGGTVAGGRPCRALSAIPGIGNPPSCGVPNRAPMHPGTIPALDAPLSSARTPGATPQKRRESERAIPTGRHAAAGGPPVPEGPSFLGMWREGKGEVVMLRLVVRGQPSIDRQ